MDEYENAVRESCVEELINTNLIVTEDSCTYTLKIRANRKITNMEKYIYWYVSCEEIYGTNEMDVFIHPFRLLDDPEAYDFIWGIVSENKITRLLIEYICLPNDKLEHETGGHTSGSGTRSRYIKMLDDLWD